jgi:two-component system, LytTR family, sensor histidine kinase AlgZ
MTSTAQAPAALSATISPIVVPDCCNIGVVFRVLVLVNLAVLAAVLVPAPSLAAGWRSFVEAAAVVELASLWSLFALCMLRRIVQRSWNGYAMERWLQRTLCAVIPAAVTGVIVRTLSATAVFQDGPLTAFKAALAAALFAALAQHYFELRARAFSPALVEARLQALQARIRPHFFFNSLNAVLSLIRSEPRRAESTLEDLAELFRALMSDARNMGSLEDEIRLGRQYLAIEQIRLGERLNVDWEYENLGEDQLARVRMPVLLLQPLLENAVRYGVEPASAPQTVRVRVSRLLDRIEIAVTNPWHGREATAVPGNQMALDNIRERLALIYDVEAQLNTRVDEGRFEVRLRFPLMGGV